MGAAEVTARLPQGRAVVCIPDARWLRWTSGAVNGAGAAAGGGLLEVGDACGRVRALPVSGEELVLVGRAFAGLGPGRRGTPQPRRIAVAVRFPAGATVLVDRRGGRCAVAASPGPPPRVEAEAAPAG